MWSSQTDITNKRHGLKGNVFGPGTAGRTGQHCKWAPYIDPWVRSSLWSIDMCDIFRAYKLFMGFANYLIRSQLRPLLWVANVPSKSLFFYMYHIVSQVFSLRSLFLWHSFPFHIVRRLHLVISHVLKLLITLCHISAG